MHFSSSVFHRMSLKIDMKMIRSSKFSGQMLFSSKSFWISWRIDYVENPGKIFFTLIQLLFHRFRQHPDMMNTSWDLQLGLSIFFLLFLDLVPSDQHVERNQRRYKLRPSTNWSLDRWPMLISSILVMNVPGLSHSEFLRNVLSINVWLMLNTFSMFSILCSCRFPNSLGNPA